MKRIIYYNNTKLIIYRNALTLKTYQTNYTGCLKIEATH